jgi:hypothetical protein
VRPIRLRSAIVRVTTLTLAILLIAACSWHLRNRRNDFAKEAAYCADRIEIIRELEHEFRTEIEKVSSSGETAMPEYVEPDRPDRASRYVVKCTAELDRLRGLRESYSAVERKYRRAMSQPWLPLPSDPPFPGVVSQD